MGNDFAVAVRKGDSSAAAAGRRSEFLAAAGSEVVHYERLGMGHDIHRILLLLDVPR